jgi:hypothetical protein
MPAPSPFPHNMGRYSSRLARGWNTSNVHSVATHVLLPEGLAIHIGLEHNLTEGEMHFSPMSSSADLPPVRSRYFQENTPAMAALLTCSFPGRGIVGGSGGPGTETTWSFLPTRCRPSQSPHCLPIVFSVNFLWSRPGTISKHPDYIETRGASALCRSTVLAQDQRGSTVPAIVRLIRTRGISICPWRARTSPPTSRSRSVSAAVNLARLQRSSLSSTGNIAWLNSFPRKRCQIP